MWSVGFMDVELKQGLSQAIKLLYEEHQVEQACSKEEEALGHITNKLGSLTVS